MFVIVLGSFEQMFWWMNLGGKICLICVMERQSVLDVISSISRLSTFWLVCQNRLFLVSCCTSECNKRNNLWKHSIKNVIMSTYSWLLYFRRIQIYIGRMSTQLFFPVERSFHLKNPNYELDPICLCNCFTWLI